MGRSASDTRPNASSLGKKSVEASSNGKAKSRPWGEWGGFEGEFGGHLGATALIFFVPLIPLLLWKACTNYDCEVTTPILMLFKGHWSVAELWAAVPAPTLNVVLAYIGWVAFQAAIMIFLPGTPCKGLPTPAGNVMPYKINALMAYWVTISAWFLFAYQLNLFSPTFIYDNFGSFISVGTIFGVALALTMYFKGIYYPTNTDRSVHGKFFYDLWMGVELNPRIGNFDLKIFFIGRVAMLGWALVLLSFAAKQHQLYGALTTSMILTVALQMIYIIDWAWKEEWYVATLDIMHDHFGYFMCYGTTCWVQVTYTAQALYLVHHPVQLSYTQVGFILTVNLLGYILFRMTNNQKLSFRASGGKTTIWGKKARGIVAKYRTADGKERESLLLASGFWGLARHFNYFCDLLITISFCMCCGYTHLLPWTYTVWMASLLVDRAARDDRRCSAKYGKAWDQYRKEVPYNIIPYVY